jgi:hypothetical protein
MDCTLLFHKRVHVGCSLGNYDVALCTDFQSFNLLRLTLYLRNWHVQPFGWCVKSSDDSLPQLKQLVT